MQYLLRWCVLAPAFVENNLIFQLSEWEFFGLVLATIIVTASGYLINDILDFPIDIINKPEKVYLGKFWSLEQARKIYWGLVIGGFLLSFYLAWGQDNLKLVLLYPLSVLILYLYSKYFKKQVLIGNLVVAGFCAGVAGLIAFSERGSLNILKNNNSEAFELIQLIFIGYMIFAFLSTMIREIVKDAEDIEGDRLGGCTTLPMVLGTAMTNAVILLLAGIFIVFLGFVMNWNFENNYILFNIFIGIFIISPTLGLLVLLNNKPDKKAFSKASALTKWIMLTGILYLPLWYFYN